jgi:hypothetical protein
MKIKNCRLWDGKSTIHVADYNSPVSYGVIYFRDDTDVKKDKRFMVGVDAAGVCYLLYLGERGFYHIKLRHETRHQSAIIDKSRVNWWSAVKRWLS